MLLLSGFRPNGTERQILMLAQGAPQFNSECSLFSVLSPDSPRLATQEGNIIEEASCAGIKSGYLEGRTFLSWQPYLNFYRACHEFQPDAIYSFGLRADLIARTVGRLTRNRAAIITGIRGTEDHREWKVTALDRLTNRSVDAWISNSQAGKQAFVRREKVSANNITVIPNAIKPWVPIERTGHWRSRWGFSDEHLVIGNVNRLVALKGHSDIVAAAPTVISAYPNARFVFIGDGELQGPLQEQINIAGLKPYFVFAGYCADVKQVLADIDIFVLSSYVEGMPNTLMEAMMAQKPCVATDVGDVNNMLDHGRCGVIVPQRNAPEMAQALLRLLHDLEYAAQLAVNARQRALDVFSPDQMIKDTLAFVRAEVREKQTKA